MPKKKGRGFSVPVISTSNRRLPSAPLQLWMHKRKWGAPYHAPPSWGKRADMSESYWGVILPTWRSSCQRNFQVSQFSLKEKDFPGDSECKKPACKAGDLGSLPGSGRSPGEGNSNPLQYSCLENPMDREAWRATVHEVAKSQTQLSIHACNANLLK